MEIERDTVTIPRFEYERMLDSEKWYYALVDAGVDNWEGFDMACQIYSGELGPEEI